MEDIIYLCPSTPEGSCTWEGFYHEVVPHFEDNHKDFFLESNSLDISTSQDHEVNYLMNLLNETYLIQTKYIKSSEVIELRVRYLGSEDSAAKISYYVEVNCGNFGFTSKNIGNGFETVTSRNGVIYIDVQAIKATCGRKLLDTLVVWIHIENEYSQYTYNSLRRRQYDNKVLESKVRESFKRLSTYRTSMRKKSIDGIETVQTINKIIKEKRRSSIMETPDFYQLFINDIIEEIFRDAMDEIEFKEYVMVDDKMDSSSENDNSSTKRDKSQEDLSTNCNVTASTEEHEQMKMTTDIVEYTSHDDFINSIRNAALSSDQNSSESAIIHEETIILKSNKNIHNLMIEIDLPCFQEDVVSSVKVATHQTADTEFIEENDRNSMGDVEDLRSCNWLLNGYSAEKDVREQNEFSEAEENYMKNIDRIRCQNCHIIMVPPIFMCSDGRSVCLTCKTSLNCGVCGIEVTDIRNIDLEDISRSISHPCRFAGKGCTEMHAYHDIRSHEVYCDYFKYKCPIGCIVVDKYYQIRSHIRLLHPSLKIVEALEHPFPRNSEFVFANKYGIFYCTAPTKVNSIEWTVDFCGLEAISFICRVKVTGKKGEKVYPLQKAEHGFKSVIFLDELKSLRLKDKHAVLHLSDY